MPVESKTFVLPERVDLIADPGLQAFLMAHQAGPVRLSAARLTRVDGLLVQYLIAGAVNRTVPILVLTTEGADHLKARARQAGATGWIVKPFDERAIVSVVRRVTGTRA